MAEDKNVHVKVAMADVLGLLAITMFTMAVTGLALGAKGDVSLLTLVANIGLYVGVFTAIAAVMAFLNENLLGTAIFGPLAIFFFTIVTFNPLAPTAPGFDPNREASFLCMLIGIIILIDAIVAFAQPVKLLPILLIVAAVAFFVTALWYDNIAQGKLEEFRQLTGILWLVYSIISWYMAAAIMMLVMKGKAVLPLLIKA